MKQNCNFGHFYYYFFCFVGKNDIEEAEKSIY